MKGHFPLSLFWQKWTSQLGLQSALSRRLGSMSREGKAKTRKNILALLPGGHSDLILVYHIFFMGFIWTASVTSFS